MRSCPKLGRSFCPFVLINRSSDFNVSNAIPAAKNILGHFSFPRLWNCQPRARGAFVCVPLPLHWHLCVCICLILKILTSKHPPFLSFQPQPPLASRAQLQPAPSELPVIYKDAAHWNRTHLSPTKAKGAGQRWSSLICGMLAGACFHPVGAFPEGWGIVKAACNYAPGAQRCCFVAELPKWFNVFLWHPCPSKCQLIPLLTSPKRL